MSDVWGTVYQMERDKALGNDADTLRREAVSLKARIALLTDAVWEFGQHRAGCRLHSGKECDCGFFDIVKTLDTEVSTDPKRHTISGSDAADDDDM